MPVFIYIFLKNKLHLREFYKEITFFEYGKEENKCSAGHDGKR